jgi:hypothetical protein
MPAMFRGRYLLPGVCFLAIAAGARADEPARTINVDPPALRLSGPDASYRLLVNGKAADGRLVDLTRTAHFQSMQPKIAEVSATGSVRAKADGTAEIAVEVQGVRQTVQVRVSDTGRPRSIHFENDIVPLLNRFACTSSGCHGSAEGQNGFKLSVFGSDPGADFNALVKEARGRRVLPGAPEHSLLLAKASGTMAHGGGTRIRRGTSAYETLRAWLAAGTPRGEAQAPHVASVRLEPRERQLDLKGQQQLRVVARTSDGREVDVTEHTRFQSNNEGLATVSEDGLVSAGQTPGEVAIMASYMGAVDTFRAALPRPGPLSRYPALAEHNFIDTSIFRKLKKLNIVPSEAADDATFLRRAYLDVIGTLPTPEEARRFLAEPRPDRRARLVEALLERPEFADYWALKWADLLRVDRQALGPKRAYAFYQWIRANIARNRPLDQFARELLTADGPLDENAPANFYKVVAKPGAMASTLSQVLLGVRIACAECHHHPYDRWTQTDYYGMQAFFTPLAVRPSGHGEAVLASGAPETKHPRTGELIPAHALGEKAVANPTPGERRLALAAWVTNPANAWFARNLANRVFAHFMGRGLVEPLDDVRDTNPPSNPELLDALAGHLVEKKFDLKQLIRTITAAQAYQLSARPNATNDKDEQNYSRALFRRIDAEVLLDMVSQTTGVAERFAGAPAGTRALQLWDSKTTHYFLKLFGRPARISACECERNHEPSVAQVLHLLNSAAIQAKLSHERGAVAKLVRASADDAHLIEELYLAFYSRPPTDAERSRAAEYLARDSSKRRQGAEDLAWSLLNSLEFVFNH